MRGERWRVLLREDGAHPVRADAHGLNVVGYMGNNILPARAGDAIRIFLMAPRAPSPAAARWPAPCSPSGCSTSR